MNQKDALDILKAGFSVFLTGQAGAGKTYLLNQYIQYLRDNKIAVAITASTGIASTHMNGMTIHSWSGIGIKESFEEQDFKNLANKDGFAQKIKNTPVVIIDEISMLHARQLDLVDEILQKFSQDSRPFGGKQMVFAGDFFQLPPIGKKDETAKDKFAFMSKAWIKLATTSLDGSPMLKVCYLTEQHRQIDDDTALSLNDILNQIRNQCVDNHAIIALNNTKFNALDDTMTRLYTHSANVDKINQDQLQKLDDKIHEYQAVFSGNSKYEQMLIKNVRSPDVLQLKVGARVMFTKNNATEQYYNGTMGVVVKFAKSSLGEDTTTQFPIVKLANGRTIHVLPESWQIEDEHGNILANLSQLPLVLAWAITVHKSQGMTLDCAEIDLSKTFEKGQGYVALSRVKSLKGLRLVGLNQTGLLLDGFAQKANARFFELSQACELWLGQLGDDELQKQHTQFIHQNAQKSVLLDQKISPKTQKYLDKAIKQQQNSKMLFDNIHNQSLDLTQLAIKINISKNELAGNLLSLICEGVLSIDDIMHLKPDDDVLEKVGNQVALLDSTDTDDLQSLIFDKLALQNTPAGRHMIGLSLLFLNKKP